MYMERLREKSTSSTYERWDDKSANVNKGATWQGQSGADKYSLENSDKPFMTKMEFSAGINNRKAEGPS